MNSVDQPGIYLNTIANISAANDPWISYPGPNPQARLKLFCFPYAGAGSSMFHSWSGLLPDFDVCLVHLPGRDKRIREPLRRELLPLVEELTDALIPHLDRPFAFLGHSMGALLCFEVARQLRRRQAAQPVRLLLSARHPAQRLDPHAGLYLLPQQEFIESTERLFGAMPEIVKQDVEILNLFLTIMRADLEMLGTYQYYMEAPLESSITVYGGQQDASVTESDLAGWREQTSGLFELKMFAGEHFFIQSSRLPLIADIRSSLSAAAH